jgi:hypothetical protein
MSVVKTAKYADPELNSDQDNLRDQDKLERTNAVRSTQEANVPIIKVPGRIVALEGLIM